MGIPKAVRHATVHEGMDDGSLRRRHGDDGGESILPRVGEVLRAEATLRALQRILL